MTYVASDRIAVTRGSYEAVEHVTIVYFEVYATSVSVIDVEFQKPDRNCDKKFGMQIKNGVTICINAIGMKKYKDSPVINSKENDRTQ